MSLSVRSAALARQRAIDISDPSAVAEARRFAASLARSLGFDQTTAGALALAVTEAGTNIVKHARQGCIVVGVVNRAGETGVEMLALDKGPGIASIAESMRDGHSTAGSAGTGLGALRRMTSVFEIFSQSGRGTLLRCEIWPRMAGTPAGLPPSGAICIPKPGEDLCGDGWLILSGPQDTALFMVDGLGHGPEAAAAAQAAMAVAVRHAGRDAVGFIEAIHAALRSTRGAAGAVLMMEPQKELCSFCGVGNIAMSIRAGGKTRSMVSHNGILGHHVRKMQEFSYPFPRGALCVAHSDGIATRWDLAAYPGLELRHPSLVAGALYRDHSRGRDDATVVAVRNPMGLAG